MAAKQCNICLRPGPLRCQGCINLVARLSAIHGHEGALPAFGPDRDERIRQYEQLAELRRPLFPDRKAA